MSDASLEQRVGDGLEAARVGSQTGHSSHLFESARSVQLPAQDFLGDSFRDRFVPDPTESIANVAERSAYSIKVGTVRACRTPFGHTERQARRIIKGLIEWWHKGLNLGADALFQRVFALAQRFGQLLLIQPRKPFVVKGMAGDFVARLMDLANLVWVVIGPFARQCGRANHGKTTWHHHH